MARIVLEYHRHPPQMWYTVRVNVQRPNRVTLTMPRELVKTARVEAIKRGTSLSAVVRQLVKMWLAGEVDLEPPATEEERLE
jgi:hypothetical protein